jgi:hypothetical protein
MVAPSARRRSSITSASLLPSRGAATRCWEAAFVRTDAILRLRLRLLATASLEIRGSIQEGGAGTAVFARRRLHAAMTDASYFSLATIRSASFSKRR